jgi:hypothetical protein
MLAMWSNLFCGVAMSKTHGFFIDVAVLNYRYKHCPGWFKDWTIGRLTAEQRDFTWRLLSMAGVGKKFEFHGAFASKEDAVKKEQEVGGFIRERVIHGKIRYFVLTEKK